MTADRTDLRRAARNARSLVGVATQAPFLARRRRHLRRVQTVDDRAIVAQLVPRAGGDLRPPPAEPVAGSHGGGAGRCTVAPRRAGRPVVPPTDR